MKAFPVIDRRESAHDGSLDGYECKDEGMDLRDYFAAKALQGLLVNPSTGTLDKSAFEVAAEDAYKYADAMMEARSK